MGKFRKRVSGCILGFAIATLSTGPAHAAFSGSSLGTAGSEFLTLDLGARGIGMAGAYTALTNDAYSLYWNPAGLSEIPQASVALMDTQYFAGINYYYMAYAQRVSSLGGVIGGGLRYLDVGDITHTDVNGNTAGSFHPRSFAYELGYGGMVPDISDSDRDITAGGTVRLIHSDILSHATGIAFDIGAQAHQSNWMFPYHYGFVLQNVGQGQKFDANRDPLPSQIRMGGAINFTSNWIASVDAVMPFYGQLYGAFGTEFTMEPMNALKMAFRTGLETDTITSGLDGFRGVNFGIGFKMSDFSFDYAFVPYGVLGNTHRFSLGYSFPGKTTGKYRER